MEVDKRIERWIGDSVERKKFYQELGRLPHSEFIKKLYEVCYNYGYSVGFDMNKLTEFANLKGLTYIELCVYMKKYALEILRKDEDEWRRERNEQLYNERLQRKVNNSSKYRTLYMMLGGGYYLDFRAKLTKYCYEYLEECNYNYLAVLEFCQKYDVKAEMFINYVRDYIKKDQENFQRVNEKIENMLSNRYSQLIKNKEKRMNIILNKLVKAGNGEEIIFVLINQKNLMELYYHVPSYVNLNYSKISEFERNDLIVNIRKKIKWYKECGQFCNEDALNKKDERIFKAVDIIKNYIDSGMINQDNYCKLKGISIIEFMNCVEIIKNNDIELYKLYMQRVERYQNKICAVIIDKIDKIVVGIKNGVIDENGKREFNLEDYYSITAMDLDSLIKFSMNFLSEEHLKILRSFAFKYRNQIKSNLAKRNDISFKGDVKTRKYTL